MRTKLFTLPNVVTLCNLACGCGAIVFALGGGFEGAFCLIAAGAVFDFADGFTARLTGQYSEVGKQLDSLADMVTFGVAPSAVLFTLCGVADRYVLGFEWRWAAFAVALFSALRLARFNVDETQREEFSGLPTPAAALAIASLGAVWGGGGMASLEEGLRLACTPSREVLVALAAAVSVLLVCPLRMFSLKFKGFGWRGNELRYTFLAVSAVLLAVLHTTGVAACVGLYVAASAVRAVVRRSVNVKK